MVKNNILKQGQLVGIMVLFVGINIMPLTGSIDIEKFCLAGEGTTTAALSRGGITIYVDDNNTEGPWDGTQEHPYRYIQDGIDNASDGDTVFVYNGSYNIHYYDPIVINKSINLIGQDKDSTFISAFAHEVEYGVVCISADNVNITGFTIQYGFTSYIAYPYPAGIDIYWSNHCNISGNNIIYNCVGIDLYHSHNCTVSGNFIVSNNFGILSRASYNSTISGNNITNNYYGLVLSGYEDAPKNIISRNIISKNHIGIFLPESFRNIIFENNITDNECGIHIARGFTSNSNLIYHNNFINNTQHAYDECDEGDNYWYNSTLNQGNYWSNYSVEDVEPPYGIGDTPYSIPGGDSQDMYPLMHPWNGTLLITPRCGDTNDDEAVNVADVVYLINYLFIVPPGPEPKPMKCVGDVNGDGIVNVSDVVSLINYLFLIPPGPAPGGCCK